MDRSRLRRRSLVRFTLLLITEGSEKPGPLTGVVVEDLVPGADLRLIIAPGAPSGLPVPLFAPALPAAPLLVRAQQHDLPPLLIRKQKRRKLVLLPEQRKQQFDELLRVSRVDQAGFRPGTGKLQLVDHRPEEEPKLILGPAEGLRDEVAGERADEATRRQNRRGHERRGEDEHQHDDVAKERAAN